MIALKTQQIIEPAYRRDRQIMWTAAEQQKVTYGTETNVYFCSKGLRLR